MRFDDMYLSDEDLSYLDCDDDPLPDVPWAMTKALAADHMRSMRQAWMRQSTQAQRSQIAARAGKARRKSASVPCPRCGAESSYNGKPRRICAKGHTFTEAPCKSQS